MTPTRNANQFDVLETSDSDMSTETSLIVQASERLSERPTQKKRFPGSAQEERTLLWSICTEALSDAPSSYRKAITTPRMIHKFRQKLQNEDITDDELRKIATNVISSEYLDQHPDHPSTVVYKPGLVNQYGETPRPSTTQKLINTPARRTPREVTVTTTTTKIAAIMQSMGVDQTQATTHDEPLSQTVIKKPKPTITDPSVQNLEESFNDQRSTPNTDTTSIQKIEESFQDQVNNEAIDMRITSSLALRTPIY